MSTMEQVFDREWQAIRRGHVRGQVTDEEARKRRVALLDMREVAIRIRRCQQKGQS